MEGDDISEIDSDYVHDHTYYGNGCPSESGSSISCSTRLINTFDGETQETGTSYDYQAVATGSAPTIVTVDNTLSPDTFCPLGWQMPYSGSGGDYYNKSKSLKYLYDYYGITDSSSSTAVLSYPFSYVKSGYYLWLNGRTYHLDRSGYYWTTIVNSGGGSYSIGITSIIRFAVTNNRAHGFPIRCVYHFSILSSTARWQETLKT